MREWNIGTPDEQAVRALQDAGCSPVLSKLLALRGFADAADAQLFLECAGILHDPLEMADMALAAQRVRQALAAGETIAVYGDYDVDGVTASALLTDYLRAKGADVMVYLPERESEGYGLNTRALEQLHACGATLCITVDTGISALEEAKAAQGLGLDLIVTDHHEPRAQLPEAFAVVDPKRPDCPYPFKGLAGVGVAFKLACAVEGANSGETLLARYGDLVCLGTVADVVPLVDENRLLVKRGLDVLAHSERIGLAALLAQAGADKRVPDASLLAFTAAPRINAAGRMDSALPALELLLTGSPARAETLATHLCACNDARKREEHRILGEAEQILQHEDLLRNRVLIVAGEGWANGVIGIVAARLAERFERPAMVISFEKDGIGRASCRSFEGFALHEALGACADLLEKYGGHALAAGFSIRQENLSAFRSAIDTVAAGCDIRPALRLDCSLAAAELTISAAEECARLEPCGAGNPAPLFYLEDVLLTGVCPLSGGKHLRLSCQMGGQEFNAVLFGADKTGRTFARGDVLDLAVELTVNEWRGRRSLSVLVRAVRESVVFDRQQARYRRLRTGEEDGVPPSRAACALVWRTLTACHGRAFHSRRVCGQLRFQMSELDYTQFLLILDVFRETGLVAFSKQEDALVARVSADKRVRLEDSPLMRRLSAHSNCIPAQGTRNI
ncbi:single-stranded-DNA-specific exonuclease RecJ [Ethanoligenens sp.]|uniref:single-stranded-DNA-specific exonuclease RecJ n=1 Tax=Ethanoligenens sp. TaxID=2099655 RepID=UPI0039E81182